MSTKLSAGRVRSMYEFIKANRAKYSVQGMCRVLAVAPSGYYEWVLSVHVRLFVPPTDMEVTSNSNPNGLANPPGAQRSAPR